MSRCSLLLLPNKTLNQSGVVCMLTVDTENINIAPHWHTPFRVHNTCVCVCVC